MIPGFKIGLADWEEKLLHCKKLTGDYPAFVEIYFRADKISEYTQMFEFLAKNQIKFGLHFWGMLKDGIEPNLLSGQKWIQNQSVMMMQSVIKVASARKCVYVNVHPGALRDRVLDLDGGSFQMAKFPEVDFENGRQNLLENTTRLQKIADKYGVLLTYETLPTNCPASWLGIHGGANLLIAKQCPIEFYEDLANAGHYVANDFGHTGCSIDMETEKDKNLSKQEKRAQVLNFLQVWTRKLMGATRLIHCNLTLPPFDGVDTHLGLRKEDFERDPLPNREELLELLRIFKDRDDVYILNEPEFDHVENYQELLRILQEV
jgi:sugar phosphate isomerase/epimerase